MTWSKCNNGWIMRLEDATLFLFPDCNHRYFIFWGTGIDTTPIHNANLEEAKEVALTMWRMK